MKKHFWWLIGGLFGLLWVLCDHTIHALQTQSLSVSAKNQQERLIHYQTDDLHSFNQNGSIRRHAPHSNGLRVQTTDNQLTTTYSVLSHVFSAILFCSFQRNFYAYSCFSFLGFSSKKYLLFCLFLI